DLGDKQLVLSLVDLIPFGRNDKTLLSKRRKNRGQQMKAKFLFIFLFLSLAASAQTYKFSMLYTFKDNGTDPSDPIGALIVDSAGNLYGTSFGGGTFGEGTVFKVTKSGTLTILHSFQRGSSDGAGPMASLIRDASGNLYGTTQEGGINDLGVIFK